MKAVEIKKDIYWVGGIDWDLRDFHGYTTERGSTYNSYLIKDEKTVLVDTAKYYLVDEMIGRIKSITDPSKIDIVVSNHVEMDHSGGLPRIMEMCPSALLVTSPNGEKGLKAHYGRDWNFKVVDTGDSLSIGRRNLDFVLTQMVHWPDSMATYIPEEKLLLPNDAFGQHIASPERFDDELGWGIVREEAAKYYANIVMPYGVQVKKALDALADLDIDMIAPSHGVIWRDKVSDIVNLYSGWASNRTVKKAVIAYDSMWGSTRAMARAVYEVFEEEGIPARLMDLKTNDISNVMTHVLDSEYICIGSPTLNSGVLPTVASFLEYIKGLSPQGRKAMAFGSYGWGGQSVGKIDEVLRGMKCDMMDPVKVRYIPTSGDIDDLKKQLRGRLT